VRIIVVALALLAGTASAKGLGDHIKIVRALEEWRIEDAEVLIAGLNEQNSAEARFLRGKLHFLRGDYDQALKLLDGLNEPQVKDIAADLARLVRTTRDATAGFATRSTAHFVISFPPGKDEVLVELAGEALERSYEEIGKDLGWYPSQKVRVEILPQIRDLARVSPLTELEIETSGTIALCKYNKLMIITPRATVFGYPWLDTLAHEYTHYVISRSTNDRVPIWLHEGLAKFEESRWRAAAGADGLGRAYQHVLATALRKGQLITFDEMHPSMAKLPSQEAAATAFAEVYTMVAYLQQKHGYEGLRDVLGRVRDGRSERRAVAEVTGKTWEAVEADWKVYLRKLDLKVDAGVAGSHRIRFEKTGADKENVGVEEIPEERARKLARLGGLLRARGRLAGAAVEYEKARALVPDDLFIAAKLARTYLDAGNPQKAVEVALPLAARDPDDAAPQATLGQALLQAGDPVRAEKHLLAAVRVSPFDPAVRCGLAQVFELTGKPDLARREQDACRRVQQP
jgi:tetratricopeptide (TPR) repeat protein